MAVFVDLDRTLIGRASGPVLNAALVTEGVIAPGRSVPGDAALYALYDRLGENLAAMALARAAAWIARGWRQADVRRAGARAVPALLELVQPFAPGILAGFRAAGHDLVLATTTPLDMVGPLAEALGFDDVIATRYEVGRDGRYTGHLDGRFVWGVGKVAAVRDWVASAGTSLSDCVACSDSVYDVPLLAGVGDPRAVNPDPRLLVAATVRRWPVEHWDRPPGVPSLLGLEPADLLRPFLRPELFPYARFSLRGLEHVPARGPVLVAANHRSYFDVAALALLAARLGRPVRFLAKRELFDAPLAGILGRAIGGIPVDRSRSGGGAMAAAEQALRAGEVVVVLPQGTIPRGRALFEPVLEGRTGTARLAAATGAPVVPVGIWGTDAVWPRCARVPDVRTLGRPRPVEVRVGPAVDLGLGDAAEDTRRIMAAIVALLPAAARRRRRPSAEELARTEPPGRSGGAVG